MRIAIQGGQASFHHAAALQYFVDQPLELIECKLFSQVCDALTDQKADYGIMAIENTVAGAILPNYLLLMSHGLQIVGEVHLRIDQNLMALPGQRLEDINTARSHPMALLQCSEFLRAHPTITPVEYFDTADSAKEIRNNQRKGVAAIAGQLAAELYDLEILAANIENENRNFTRFLILSREMLADSAAANKATISFSIHHRPGALLEVLQIFYGLGLNLTLIQSVPLAGKPYEYSFCVDFEFDGQSILQAALTQIREAALEVSVIGVYLRGIRTDQNEGLQVGDSSSF